MIWMPKLFREKYIKTDDYEGPDRRSKRQDRRGRQLPDLGTMLGYALLAAMFLTLFISYIDVSNDSDRDQRLAKEVIERSIQDCEILAESAEEINARTKALEIFALSIEQFGALASAVLEESGNFPEAAVQFDELAADSREARLKLRYVDKPDCKPIDEGDLE